MITTMLDRVYLKFNMVSTLSQGSSMKIEEIESDNLYFMNRFHKYLTSKSDIDSKSKIN
jgi:hypothetical protein